MPVHCMAIRYRFLYIDRWEQACSSIKHDIIFSTQAYNTRRRPRLSWQSLPAGSRGHPVCCAEHRAFRSAGCEDEIQHHRHFATEYLRQWHLIIVHVYQSKSWNFISCVPNSRSQPVSSCVCDARADLLPARYWSAALNLGLVTAL